MFAFLIQALFSAQLMYNFASLIVCFYLLHEVNKVFLLFIFETIPVIATIDFFMKGNA